MTLPEGTVKDVNDLLRSGEGAVKRWVESLVAPFPEVPFMPPPAFPAASPAIAPVPSLFSEDMCRATDGSWSFEWVDKYFDRFPNNQAAEVEAVEWVRASISAEQAQKFTAWQTNPTSECPVSLPLFHALTRKLNLSVLDDQLTCIGMDFMAQYDNYATQYAYAVRAARCKRFKLPVGQPPVVPITTENLSAATAINIAPKAEPVTPVSQCVPRSASQRRALAAARTGVSYPARTALRNKADSYEEDHVVKATIVAKPKSYEVTPAGGVKVIIDFQYEKPVAFPKGVPPLPTNPFTITAFVGSKQWKKVEPTLTDPEDKLILDGQFAVDPALGLVLYCTNANSLKLQRAGKEAPTTEPKAESQA